MSKVEHKWALLQREPITDILFSDVRYDVIFVFQPDVAPRYNL